MAQQGRSEEEIDLRRLLSKSKILANEEKQIANIIEYAEFLLSQIQGKLEVKQYADYRMAIDFLKKSGGAYLLLQQQNGEKKNIISKNDADDNDAAPPRVAPALPPRKVEQSNNNNNSSTTAATAMATREQQQQRDLLLGKYKNAADSVAEYRNMLGLREKGNGGKTAPPSAPALNNNNDDIQQVLKEASEKREQIASDVLGLLETLKQSSLNVQKSLTEDNTHISHVSDLVTNNQNKVQTEIKKIEKLTSAENSLSFFKMCSLLGSVCVVFIGVWLVMKFTPNR